MNLFDIITGRLSRMSYVNRYSSFPVHRRENVAEHSYWVAMIALLIARDLNTQGNDFDLGVILERALLHDVDECVSGDIIRSFKYSTDELHDAIDDAAEINVRELTSKMGRGVGNELAHAWREAKNVSHAGDIVKFADMAAVAFYCREEHQTGNRAIMPTLKEAYEEWFHVFHNHPLLGQYINQMFPEGRFFDMLREESLPAKKVFDVFKRPIMRDHSEGETLADAYDSAAWPERTPLG